MTINDYINIAVFKFINGLTTFYPVQSRGKTGAR